MAPQDDSIGSRKRRRANRNDQIKPEPKPQRKQRKQATKPVTDTQECHPQKTCRNQHQPDDIFLKILQSKHSKPSIENGKCSQRQLLWDVSKNILHSLERLSHGWSKQALYSSRHLGSPVASMVSQMQLYRTASPFDRRCTAMEWHPTHPHLIAVGSKGGDIILWDIHNINNEKFIQGIGAGGSIQAIKFYPEDHGKVLTSSIDGTVSIHDLDKNQRQIIQDTMNCHDFWYCSVDVSARNKTLVAGDNVGKVNLLTMDGQQVWQKKLHKQKVTHTEFSPREPWLLATASTDKTVQLWDIRNIKDNKSALYRLTHERPINSAYFSQTDGTRLLTTDQHHEIRVYRAPFFHLERTIEHPHRFFQHITPIKAQWHPLQDLIVVGRYPDPSSSSHTQGEKRTIDVYEADTGAILCQLYDPEAKGIVSLNQFSRNGNYLASGMGANILIWARMEELAERQDRLLEKFKQQMAPPAEPSSNRGQNRRQPQTKQKNTKVKDTKTKVKTKTKTQQKQKKEDADP